VGSECHAKVLGTPWCHNWSALMGKLLGYARVSSAGQDLSVQREALKKAGVHVVFEEKATAPSATAARSWAKCCISWGATTLSW
jgi:resolvase-like protein